MKLERGQMAAMSVYGEPIPALAMVLEEDFPDLDERKAFGEKVKKEFMTSNYPMYVKLYAPLVETIAERD
jgi:hypothetical protein